MIILLISALTYGFILAFLALGVSISFRIFDFTDITVDGSYTLGAALCGSLIVGGVHPVAATLLAFLGGFAAGMTTGFLHTRFRINKLLSGILVMTALYSMNLYILRTIVLYIPYEETLMIYPEKLGGFLLGGAGWINILGSSVRLREVSQCVAALIAVPFLLWMMYLFFRTHLGLAMRATGDNARMVRALGVPDRRMIVLGLGLSNGLVALSGAHMAQLQGYADIQMGIGMIVMGLASVILGSSLIRRRRFGASLVGTVLGSVLFRLLVALVLWLGLGNNDLKLFTTLFVLAALVAPRYFGKFRRNVAAGER